MEKQILKFKVVSVTEGGYTDKRSKVEIVTYNVKMHCEEYTRTTINLGGHVEEVKGSMTYYINLLKKPSFPEGTVIPIPHTKLCGNWDPDDFKVIDKEMEITDDVSGEITTIRIKSLVPR